MTGHKGDRKTLMGNDLPNILSHYKVPPHLTLEWVRKGKDKRQLQLQWHLQNKSRQCGMVVPIAEGKGKDKRQLQWYLQKAMATSWTKANAFGAKGKDKRQMPSEQKAKTKGKDKRQRQKAIAMVFAKGNAAKAKAALHEITNCVLALVAHLK